MHVLITGAGGRLGQKLFDRLERDDNYTVSGVDRMPNDHPRIHSADLAHEGHWVDHLKGVDVIVHLAGDSNVAASWPSAVENNIDATMKLYHHAVEQGVKRVVLASSNWVQGDKRFTGGSLTSQTPPGPINAYGMSKLFAERAGAYFSETHDLSVICLRIGWAQLSDNDRPGPQMALGRWAQEMWLSERDFLSGMLCAIRAQEVPFAVLNLVSSNPGMRWDISEAERVLGYVPQDGAAVQVTPKIALKSWLKGMLVFKLPSLGNRWFPDQ